MPLQQPIDAAALVDRIYAPITDEIAGAALDAANAAGASGSHSQYRQCVPTMSDYASATWPGRQADVLAPATTGNALWRSGAWRRTAS